MIILDTDVLSATFRPESESAIIRWLNVQRFEALYITSVTLFEIVLGIEEMPKGSDRHGLEIALADALRTFLRGRILIFDEQAALQAGRLFGLRRERGKIVGIADTQIAGIALNHRATLATGNVRHFDDLEIPVVNPWQA